MKGSLSQTKSSSLDSKTYSIYDSPELHRTKKSSIGNLSLTSISQSSSGVPTEASSQSAGTKALPRKTSISSTTNKTKKVVKKYDDYGMYLD